MYVFFTKKLDALNIFELHIVEIGGPHINKITGFQKQMRNDKIRWVGVTCKTRKNI